MGTRLLSFAILILIWILFSGLFDRFHLALGVISAAFVSFYSSDLLFSDSRKRMAARVREAIRAPGYLVWLFYQVVLANIHILRLALTPKGSSLVEPRIVRHKMNLHSDFARYVLANSITLTPGTVSVKVDGDYVLVHAISKHAASGVGGEMEERVGHVFDRDN